MFSKHRAILDLILHLVATPLLVAKKDLEIDLLHHSSNALAALTA